MTAKKRNNNNCLIKLCAGIGWSWIGLDWHLVTSQFQENFCVMKYTVKHHKIPNPVAHPLTWFWDTQGLTKEIKIKGYLYKLSEVFVYIKLLGV